MTSCCIVGYGAIATVHAKALTDIKNTNLYAVCDVDSKRLEAAEAEYKGIKTFTSFDEAVKCSEIDSFHICTPHYLHYSMTEKVLKFNKSVVVEKPVAITKEDYYKLLNYSKEKEVCLVFQNRYNPCFKKLIELAKSEEYGKILGINATLFWSRDAEYYTSSPWKGKLSKEGGGVLINQAIHTLDLVTCVLGKPVCVKAIKTNFSLKNIIEVEDTITSSIDFENGSRCMFFATNGAKTTRTPQLEIIFEKAVLIYCDRSLYLNGEIILDDKFTDFKGKECWGSGHEILLEDFYNNKNSISPLDAKNTYDTLFAMYESAEKNGAEVYL